jgi:hypothetical protein
MSSSNSQHYILGAAVSGLGLGSAFSDQNMSISQVCVQGLLYLQQTNMNMHKVKPADDKTLRSTSDGRPLKVPNQYCHPPGIFMSLT